MDFFKQLWHGAAYYPEQWQESDIDQDIAYMKTLGLNNVRMMEFAWSILEPTEDTFDFSLFDRVIEKLYVNGISTILGTPTATPPRWFTLKYPDSLYVNQNLQPLGHGSREHVCLNNDDFIERTKILIQKIAEHYAKNPAVIAYQVHNEPNCPVHECFCIDCQRKWSNYLRKRYKTIENLNQKWGTEVWSTKYPSFESMIPPLPTPYLHSTSLLSVYRQYNYENVAGYLSLQAEILRKYSDKPICTNVFRPFEMDFDSAFENLDFVGLDEYSTEGEYPESTLNFDRVRNTCKNPFFIIETPPTSGGTIV